MDINLNVKERLMAMVMLPKEGNFLTLKEIRRVREDLSFTPEELDTYKIQQQQDGYKWDVAAGKEEKPFQLSDFSVDLLKKTLKELDAKQKLTEDHIPLYQKIIGD